MPCVVSATIICVGVFELARKIHELPEEDRVVVLHLVEDLRLGAASTEVAVRTPERAIVPPLIIPRTG